MRLMKYRGGTSVVGVSRPLLDMFPESFSLFECAFRFEVDNVDVERDVDEDDDAVRADELRIVLIIIRLGAVP